MRFVSPNKQKQKIGRKYGALLTLIGMSFLIHGV